MKIGSKEKPDVDLELDIVHENERAWLLSDGTHEGWVSKSQARLNADGGFTMPIWLGYEIGFI
jgi:hypothetical protein